MRKLLTIAVAMLAMACSQAQTRLPFDVAESVVCARAAPAISILQTLLPTVAWLGQTHAVRPKGERREPITS